MLSCSYVPILSSRCLLGSFIPLRRPLPWIPLSCTPRESHHSSREGQRPPVLSPQPGWGLLEDVLQELAGAERAEVLGNTNTAPCLQTCQKTLPTPVSFEGIVPWLTLPWPPLPKCRFCSSDCWTWH